MTTAEIERNVKTVRAEIARAAAEAGRSPREFSFFAKKRVDILGLLW